MRCGGPGLCSECTADASRARAALAQRSEFHQHLKECADEVATWPSYKREALTQPSPKCVKCGGTGEADSGGVHPWGEPILIPCDCETEKAEAERPEVVAVRYEDGTILSAEECGIALEVCAKVQTPLMTVAQHERIVGELRAKADQLREALEWRKENQAGQRELLRSVKAERDAALARVAEMERQEPVVRAYGVLPPFAEKVLAKLRRFYDCAEDFESGGVDIGRHWLDLLTQLGLLNRVQRSPALWEISQQGEDLLEAPVAQAQQLNDLDKQCRDDVARALGLRPNQERGFAWSYLLASIKSCVKTSGDSAQAQHSVPETTNEEANSFLRVADAGQFKDNAAAVRTAAMIIRGLLHRPAIMKSIIRHRIGLTPEYEGQWHADMYGEDGEVQHHAEADTPDEAVRAVVALAAAPGKEGCDE